jgi:hypothetical protein
MFDVIERHRGKVFLIWTADPALSLLRNPNPTALSTPYKALLFDMRALMRNEESKVRGALTFDQRHHREDEAAACAISNYLIRTRGDWSSRFTQIPNFTSSAISPGLQAADLVVHLGPHLADRTQRPELATFIERIEDLRYEFRRGQQQRLVKTIRRAVKAKEKGAGERKLYDAVSSGAPTPIWRQDSTVDRSCVLNRRIGRRPARKARLHS